MAVCLLKGAYEHGKPKPVEKGTHHFGTSLVGVAFQFAILYWGGFFK